MRIPPPPPNKKSHPKGWLFLFVVSVRERPQTPDPRFVILLLRHHTTTIMKALKNNKRITMADAFYAGSDTIPNKFDVIVNDLNNTGLSIYDDFISPLLVHNLAHEAKLLWAEGAFKQARVGKGAAMQLRSEIRNDCICWLNPENPSAVQRPYCQDLETLRHHINRHMFLGLFEYEGHFALYPPGASYKLHYDRFIGAHQRVVSCILYLNHAWSAADGGALKIHAPNTNSNLDLPIEVLPQAGRLVTFISETFPHEVLTAYRDRLSLTGWFRIRD